MQVQGVSAAASSQRSSSVSSQALEVAQVGTGVSRGLLGKYLQTLVSASYPQAHWRAQRPFVHHAAAAEEVRGETGIGVLIRMGQHVEGQIQLLPEVPGAGHPRQAEILSLGDPDFQPLAAGAAAALCLADKLLIVCGYQKRVFDMCHGLQDVPLSEREVRDLCVLEEEDVSLLGLLTW